MGIERFEDIEAWQLARELTRLIYSLSKKPKFFKDYGLKKQIRDAAGSSMHNIAEGFDSETNPEFIRFLRYAKRSCTEVTASYMWPWMKRISLQKNLKTHMILPEGRVRRYVASSTICLSMKDEKSKKFRFRVQHFRTRYE